MLKILTSKILYFYFMDCCGCGLIIVCCCSHCLFFFFALSPCFFFFFFFFAVLCVLSSFAIIPLGKREKCCHILSCSQNGSLTYKRLHINKSC